MTHGRFYTYDRLGCRCIACRRANRLRVQRWELATGHGADPIRVSADPTRAHIATLRASGWTLVELAAELRMSKRTLEKLTAAAKAGRTMDRRTADQILSVAPLEPVDVDEVAVMRLLDGTLHWQAATLPEREAAGRIAMTRDGGYKFCADVLHLGPGAMRRVRAAAGVMAVAS